MSTITTTKTTTNKTLINKRNRDNFEEFDNQQQNENKSTISIPTLSFSEFQFVQQYYEIQNNLKKQKQEQHELQQQLQKQQQQQQIETKIKIPILSIYIQKIIIGYLVEYINKNCKINNPIKHIKKQNETNKLIGSLSLTCWDWFKYLSIRCNVITDFNMTLNENKIINLQDTTPTLLTPQVISKPKSQPQLQLQSDYKLFKNENISFIKFYKICNLFDDQENVNNLNWAINKFPNLKRILIVIVRDDNQLKVIGKLKFGGKIEIGNLYLKNTSIIPDNIIEIKKISMLGSDVVSTDKLIQVLPRFKPKEIINESTQIPFKQLVLSKSQCFSNLKSFDNQKVTMGIEDLNFLLSSSINSLKSLSIEFCCNNLFYFLSNGNQQYKCNLCLMDSTTFENYKFHWPSITSFKSNHKHLKNLSINNSCQHGSNSNNINYQVKVPLKFSNNINNILLRKKFNYFNISRINSNDYLDLNFGD